MSSAHVTQSVLQTKLQVARASLKSPEEVVGKLLDAGAILPEDRKAAVEFVLKALLKRACYRVAITRRAGWHGTSFVTVTGTIGDDRETLRLASSAGADLSVGQKQGSLDRWREGLLAPCYASSFLTFALSIGFAGPLLDIISEDEGVVFNFYGPSSSGKSLAARSLHSQAGRARKSDLATYDITDRGVEELCFACNDWAAVFDEEGRAKGGKEQRRERVRTIAFMVPSGRGMMRSEKAARDSALANLTWRLFAISSGEKPLEDSTNRRAAGEQLRHIDIEVPDPKHCGIFDRLDGSRTRRVKQAIRLARQVEDAIPV